MSKRSKKPYNDRDDLDKLQSQWNKINGILSRDKEWSAAIVRAATAAEIAANIAIRKQFGGRSEFPPKFIDNLLTWANGIDGKFRRLIIPLEDDPESRKILESLYKKAAKLNDKRNEIVHRGTFSKESEARTYVDLAREIIHGLVQPYGTNFQLGTSA